MKIYIDINNGFECYTSNESGTLLEFEEPDFDGKCTEFVEGYRCKPVGYTWTNENGSVFNDTYKMIAPWRDYALLEEFQAQYEAQLTALAAAYTEGVNSI